MALRKVSYDVLPKLRDILAGNFDPAGGYVDDPKNPGNLILKPWDKDHQPGAIISLNSQDYQGFQLLCQKTKVTPSPVTDLGGGGAMIAIKDLALAISKLGAEDKIEIDELSVE